MADITEIYRHDTLKEEGVVGIWSKELGQLQATPVTESREYLGQYKLPVFSAPTEVTEGITYHLGCVEMPGSALRSPQLDFDYYAKKNPIMYNILWGEGNQEITLGAPVTIDGLTPATTDKTVVSLSVDDGVFLGIVKNIDYANYLVQSLVVKDTQTVPVTFVEGVDYTLTRYNGHTAIKTIIGGGITEGLELEFTYTYTPAIQVTETTGADEFTLKSYKWFIRSNTNGIAISEQDKIIEYTFNSGQIGSDLLENWFACENAGSQVVGTPVTITSLKGTGVDRDVFFRA